MSAPLSNQLRKFSENETSSISDDGSRMERLLRAIQELSLTRDLPGIQRIVNAASRELAESDGTTFVLLEDGQCYYADEDAIGPLWKGRRFPMESCISGWVMQHRRPAVIRDIYADDRIPHEAYRPTFVKSLVMVPIRSMEPIGAIGNYWATEREPRPFEVTMLQALADSTSMALEAVQLQQDIRRLLRERAAAVEEAREHASQVRSPPVRRGHPDPTTPLN